MIFYKLWSKNGVFKGVLITILLSLWQLLLINE